jgi:hypothetical protein
MEGPERVEPELSPKFHRKDEIDEVLMLAFEVNEIKIPTHRNCQDRC